jgi:hypothetical protein
VAICLVSHPLFPMIGGPSRWRVSQRSTACPSTPSLTRCVHAKDCRRDPGLQGLGSAVGAAAAGVEVRFQPLRVCADCRDTCGHAGAASCGYPREHAGRWRLGRHQQRANRDEHNASPGPPRSEGAALPSAQSWSRPEVPRYSCDDKSRSRQTRSSDSSGRFTQRSTFYDLTVNGK